MGIGRPHAPPAVRGGRWGGLFGLPTGRPVGGLLWAGEGPWLTRQFEFAPSRSRAVVPSRALACPPEVCLLLSSEIRGAFPLYRVDCEWIGPSFFSHVPPRSKLTSGSAFPRRPRSSARPRVVRALGGVDGPARSRSLGGASWGLWARINWGASGRRLPSRHAPLGHHSRLASHQTEPLAATVGAAAARAP